MPSFGSSGPSARTRSRIGFVSTPSTSAPGPSTIPSACLRPNSTSTASPAARSASRSGTRYENGRRPAAPAASTATATIPSAVTTSNLSSDPRSTIRVPGLLGADDLVDPSRGLRDLPGLVWHDVVVVVLARELQRRIPLADVELVGGLRRARLEPREQVLQRRRDQEHEERLGDLLLDHRGALDVDLEDRVPAGGERRPDLVAGRAVPVGVDQVRLEEAAGGTLVLELLGREEVVVHAVDLVLASRAGGARDHEVPLRLRGDETQRRDHGVLAHARWPGHDDEHRAGGARERLLARHWRSRRAASTASSSAGSDASARINLPLDGDVSSSRHECRNRRSRPAGPRRDVPVPYTGSPATGWPIASRWTRIWCVLPVTRSSSSSVQPANRSRTR